jgi:LysM domain
MCGHEQRKRTMTQYTVKPGDTLWGIAQSQCGDGSVWPVIYFPSLVHIGVSRPLDVEDLAGVNPIRVITNDVFVFVVDLLPIVISEYLLGDQC